MYTKEIEYQMFIFKHHYSLAFSNDMKHLRSRTILRTNFDPVSLTGSMTSRYRSNNPYANRLTYTATMTVRQRKIQGLPRR